MGTKEGAMEQTLRNDPGEPDAAELEQAIDSVFKQIRECDDRMRARQIRIDRLRDETQAILSEIKALR
jgi:hypothetical protein